jgi:hypothetical protein
MDRFRRRRPGEPRGAVRWPLRALIHHFMFGPSYESGCPVNSSFDRLGIQKGPIEPWRAVLMFAVVFGLFRHAAYVANNGRVAARVTGGNHEAGLAPMSFRATEPLTGEL